MGRSGRYLDAVEEQFEARQIDNNFAVEYRGDLKVDSLRRAFKLLSVRHPVLRSHTFPSGDRFVLEVVEGRDPEFSVVEGGESELLKESDFFFGRYASTRVRRPVAKLVVIRGASSGYVVLYMNHALMYGFSFVEYQRQLFALYDRIVSGEGVVADRGMLPRSPVALFRGRWPDRDCEPRFWPKPATDIVTLDGLFWPILLNVEETASLRAAARSHGVSVSGLLFGIALRSYCDVVDTEGNSMEVWVQTSLDLARHVRPPVNSMNTTYSVGACFVPIQMSSRISYSDVWKQYKLRVDEAIRSRHVLFPGLSCSGIRSSRCGDIIYNNAGKFPAISPSGNLAVVDAFVPFEKIGKMKGRSKVPLEVGYPVCVNPYSYDGMTRVYLTALTEDEPVLGNFESRLRLTIASMRGA